MTRADTTPLPPDESTGGIKTVAVASTRDLEVFLRVPWRIYADDPAWVPPLLLERRQHLSPAKNPYFQHARLQAWVAYRDGEPVGRITAQVDDLHLQQHADTTGFFGMIEADDCEETFAALLQAAEDWLREQGMGRVRGPFSLSINDESGLLVEGFETPPQIMMGHARPYFGPRIENQGYHKAKDLLAYRLASDFRPTRAMELIRSRVAGKIRLRPIGRKTFARDLETICDIFRDSWENNWGFIPLTDAEIQHLGANMRQFVDLNFAQIAEVEGTPAAMLVGFPNINEAIRDLDGRLLPFGWLKLLWRIKVSYPKSGRAALMGVRQKYQRSALGAALALALMERARDCGVRRGIREMELSWILEDNRGMRSIVESLGADPYKRYRVYEKSLS